MRDLYAQQLRNDSLSLVVPITVFATVLFSALAYIGQREVDSSFAGLLVTIFLSISAGKWSWDLSHKERQWEGGLLLIVVHMLLISFNYGMYGNPRSALPLLFSFLIVISSTILKPDASFRVWAGSVVCMLAALWYMGALNTADLIAELPIVVVNFLLAVASFVTSIDWMMAVNASFEAHLKSQRRRDELFEVQEELKRTNAKREFLYAQLATSMGVGQRITAILDLDTLLSQVAELVKSQLGFAYVGIFVLDEVAQKLVLRTEARPQYDPSPASQAEPPQLDLHREHVISLAARHHHYVAVADTQANKYPPHPYMLINVRSETGIPLMMGGRLLGVLNIQSYSVESFNADNLSMLQSLADQVSIAINNATLYRDQVLRYRLTATMNQIQTAISSTIELDTVLDLILENLVTIVPFNRAAVFVHRQDVIEMVASRGFPEGSQNIRIPIRDSEDIFLKLADSKAPLAIPDVSNYPNWTAVETLPSVRAWLGVPLLVNDEATGMLSLAREVAKPYTNDEIDLTTTFAAQAAVALQNARLYNRTKRFNQQLEYEVAQRTEALTEAYDRLEKLDRTKSDFIEVASHELRTPLTILKGYSDILRHDGKLKENDYYRQMVDGIYSGAVRMHEIVNDMLDVAKIDNQELSIYPEPVSMRVLIETVTMRLEEAFKERQQQFYVDGMDGIPPIEGDPDALMKVFRHLVLNAIKYTPDGGAVTITGQLYDPHRHRAPKFPDGREAIHITVYDTGIGIDPNHHELIFAKFYQTGKVALHSTSKTKFKGGGPGLGLAIARGIVLAHNGDIWVESVGHDEATMPGSQFHVVLPLRRNE
ncbi:MAG: GAF domain-containing protein [Chloroflexi bacterium]|nr:GAF domain-containing protein [Chloroflexota bacterium]